MTPTPKLRFVERSVPLHPFCKTLDADGNLVQATQTYRVLQQWWDDDSWKHVNHFDANGNHISTGKWIDIPLEKEE